MLRNDKMVDRASKVLHKYVFQIAFFFVFLFFYIYISQDSGFLIRTGRFILSMTKIVWRRKCPFLSGTDANIISSRHISSIFTTVSKACPMVQEEPKKKQALIGFRNPVSLQTDKSKKRFHLRSKFI